jgi:hypothetical protein
VAGNVLPFDAIIASLAMQDTRALKNGTNLRSWRAWEEAAYRRSGFTTILGGVFALMLVFVFSLSLFGRRLGDDLVRMAFIGLILYLATCLALMAVAVFRLNAWKGRNPWAPPS